MYTVILNNRVYSLTAREVRQLQARGKSLTFYVGG